MVFRFGDVSKGISIRLMRTTVPFMDVRGPRGTVSFMSRCLRRPSRFSGEGSTSYR